MSSFTIGQKVTTSGYPGVIVREYSKGMYEVRLERGMVCVDACDIRPVERDSLSFATKVESEAFRDGDVLSDVSLDDIRKASPIRVTLGGVDVTMLDYELEELKTLIKDRKQEKAMRLLKERTGMEFSKAVRWINQLQISTMDAFFWDDFGPRGTASPKTSEAIAKNYLSGGKV